MYFKHPKVDVSERIEIFPARDLAKTGSQAGLCQA
jgi:hypothetical protein